MAAWMEPPTEEWTSQQDDEDDQGIWAPIVTVLEVR